VANWKEFKIADADALKKFIPKCCDDDDVLYRFALCRNHDLPSASKRYFKFCAALNDIGMTSLTALTPEVVTGLNMRCWHILDTPDKKGRAVMNLYCKNLTWENVPVRAAQHCMIFMCWRHLTLFGYMGQVGGVVQGMYMEGMSMSMIKMEFEHFCTRCMTQMLPMKLAAGYMVDEPWSFRNVLWPMMKGMFKEKVRNRIVWVHKEPDEKKGRLVKYAELHEALPRDCIPLASGGTVSYVMSNYIAALEKQVATEEAVRVGALIDAAESAKAAETKA